MYFHMLGDSETVTKEPNIPGIQRQNSIGLALDLSTQFGPEPVSVTLLFSPALSTL